MSRPGVASVLLAALLAACNNDTSAGPPASTTSQRPSIATTSPQPAAPSTGSPSTPTRAVARVARWRLPYAVARAAVVRTGRGAVTLAGGLVPGDQSTDHVVRLDLSSGRTTPLPPLSVPVHDSAAALVGGHPAVVGGGSTSEQAAVQSLGRGGWRRVGSLPTARSDLNVVEWRRHAYVIGGYDGTSEPTAVLRLSSTAVSQTAARLLHGVRYAATARVGSQVFVIGGESAGRELATIQRVDLSTGRVRPAGRLPVALGHAMAAAVGGTILVVGGRVTPSRQTDLMWWFDPATGRCRPAGHLPTPLSDAAVASEGRRIWLLGGETPAITDAVVSVSAR
jgi:hypothetical protein